MRRWPASVPAGALAAALAAPLAIHAGPAAADDAAAAPLFQPGAWTAGAWRVQPQLGVAAGRNDNLRLQPADRIASPFVAALPTLTAERRDGEESTQLQWRAEWTRFTRSPADDTLNDELSTGGLRLLGPRTALTWNLAWQDWHDTLGLESPDAPVESPDHFHAAALGVVLRHDAGTDAAWRLELEPTLAARRYLDHRERTAEADADTATLVGRGLWSTASGRRVGVELRTTRTRYPAGDLALDNDDVRALATLQWDAGSGGAAGGSASLGGQRRRFDAFRPTYHGATWDLSWQWSTGPATVLSLALAKAAGEAPGEGIDELVTQRIALGLAHDWSARWHASASVSDVAEHAVGTPIPRDDHLRSAGVTVQLDLSRRWRLGLDLGWIRRTSQVAAFDFVRRLGSLQLTAAL